MKFQIYYLKIFLTEYENLNPWFVWPDCATVENRNTRLNPKFKEFCLGDRTLIILEKRVYIKSLKTCCMLTPSTIVTNHLWSIRPQKTCILRDLGHRKVMLGTFDPNSLRTFFLPVWHIRPVKPGGQKQENMLTPSLHVPPCWQGWLAHSSMSALKKK